MTMNGDAPDSAPEAAPTIEELIRTTLEEVREVRAIETRHAVDIAGMRGDLARHMDRLEGKIDAAISDSRQTRAELKAHGRLLTHMFESLGALVTHADRDREEILQIKGGLAIVRDHTCLLYTSDAADERSS